MSQYVPLISLSEPTVIGCSQKYKLFSNCPGSLQSFVENLIKRPTVLACNQNKIIYNSPEGKLQS